jgi:hypothetical protein
MSKLDNFNKLGRDIRNKSRGTTRTPGASEKQDPVVDPPSDPPTADGSPNHPITVRIIALTPNGTVETWPLKADSEDINRYRNLLKNAALGRLGYMYLPFKDQNSDGSSIFFSKKMIENSIFTLDISE